MEQYIVVGAGFSGATLAERLAASGASVTVFERRSEVGGSAADYALAERGIIQKYGPHVFHTNATHVWDYVQRFGEWRPFEYRVAASVGEHLIPLPLGFEGLRLALGGEAESLIRRLTEHYGLGARVNVFDLERDFPDLGRWAVDNIFRCFTEKHWGMPLEAVPASVLRRLPVVIGDQPTYFTDKYQALPEHGYSALIERMLDHPRINLVLSTDFHSTNARPGARVIYTGSPDYYFGEAGTLPYRSVRFMTSEPWSDPQGFATVTYPTASLPFTRATHMALLNSPRPVRSFVVSDFPEAYVPGLNDPFYPIPLEANVRKAQQYDYRRPKNIWFCGRLGSYQYLNMDQAIAQALALFERIKNT